MDYTNILDRLKERYNLTDDKDLAKLLEVSPAVMSNWRLAKNNPRLDIILEKALSDQVSLDWLFSGSGEMLVSNPLSDGNRKSRDLETLEEEARKIQAMFDRGLIKVPGGPVSSTLVTPIEHGDGRCKIIEIPLCIHAVAAGSPADSPSTVDQYMSLPATMVKHPGKTYAVKASGDSMIGAGIEEGDILIVDKAMEAKNKNIVIASINGEQTVKRLMVKKGVVSLAPGNPKYQPIELTQEMDFRSLGVVIWVIRKTG